jgi:hypothetical protein
MSTTPKTRRELIDQVLDNLGVLVEGQAPSGEMVSKVDRLVDAHMASLRTREIVYVANVGTPSPPAGGAFDLELFLAIADSLAFRAAPSFNLAGDPSLKTLALLGEDELRVIARPARTRRMLRVDKQTRGDRRIPAGNFTRGT